MCSRKGYKKDGGFVEVMLNGDSDYEAVVEQAAATLDLEEEEGSTELHLFRVDGTVIPNTDVDVGGVTQSWTLERYLRSQGKTAAQMKLGVGYRYMVSMCINGNQCNILWFGVL